MGQAWKISVRRQLFRSSRVTLLSWKGCRLTKPTLIPARSESFESIDSRDPIDSINSLDPIESTELI